MLLDTIIVIVLTPFMLPIIPQLSLFKVNNFQPTSEPKHDEYLSKGINVSFFFSFFIYMKVIGNGYKPNSSLTRK